MGKVIAISSTTEGTGKTTLTVEMGQVLAKNHKILLVDNDLQTNLSKNLAIKTSNAEINEKLIESIKD